MHIPDRGLGRNLASLKKDMGQSLKVLRGNPAVLKHV